MWFFLALASAIIYSFRTILEKWSLKTIDHYILALAVRLFALPFFTLPFILGIAQLPDISQLPIEFWFAIFSISFVFTPLEMILFYKALKREEVSYVAPLLGMSPLFTTFFAFVLFGERPSLMGLLGISLIIFALYLLNVSRKQKNIWEPLVYLFKNSAFKLVFLMMISYSLGIVIDKLGIVHSDVYFYSLANYIFVSLALFIIAFVKSRQHFHQLSSNAKPLLAIGVVVAVYTLLRFAALDTGETGYVAAILASSVFFSVILGVVLFKEKNVLKKILVGILVLSGLIIVRLFG